jgi:hypothetical protein
VIVLDRLSHHRVEGFPGQKNFELTEEKSQIWPRRTMKKGRRKTEITEGARAIERLVSSRLQGSAGSGQNRVLISSDHPSGDFPRRRFAIDCPSVPSPMTHAPARGSVVTTCPDPLAPLKIVALRRVIEGGCSNTSYGCR